MPDTTSPPLTIAVEIGRLLGCRWSIALLTNIRAGIDRPGTIQRANKGLSEKVMRFCLSRMVDSGVLQRVDLPGRIKGTSYQTTDYGQRVISILDLIVATASYAPVPDSVRTSETGTIHHCPSPR